jgi:hypothetical protein
MAGAVAAARHRRRIIPLPARLDTLDPFVIIGFVVPTRGRRADDIAF